MSNKPHLEEKLSVIQDCEEEDSNSDDDELLKFVAFPKKTKSRPTVTSDESKLSSSLTVRHKEGMDQIEDSMKIEKSAQTRARVASIPHSINTPFELYWQTRQIKGGITHLPCRECDPDECLGLNLKQNWDPNQKALVQYIDGCLLTQRNLVSRNSMTPYHGINFKDKEREKVLNGFRTTWCNEKLGLLQKRRRKMRWSAVDICAEQLYLQRVLDYSINKFEEIEKEEKQQNILLSQVTVSSQQTVENKEVEAEGVISGSSDDESFTLSKHKSELIRCGDVISYYSPIFVFGNSRGLRRATILAVDPKADSVLKLSNGDILPKDTPVKRVEIMYRGKLRDYDEGKFKEIESYKLRKDLNKRGSNISEVNEEVERLRHIVQRNQTQLKRKLQESGLGDCSDMMNRYK